MTEQQSATNNQKTYYVSTDKNPFNVAIMPWELNQVSYPFIADAPDPSIKSPKYDYSLHKWIENDSDSQGQMISDLQTQVKSLVSSNQELSTANQETDTALKQVTDGQKQTNTQLAEILKLIAPSAVAKPTTQPTPPVAQPTNPSPATTQPAAQPTNPSAATQPVAQPTTPAQDGGAQ